MPKIKPDIDQWFDYPDDPYNGRVLVRLPRGGEVQRIVEQTTEYIAGPRVFRMNGTNEQIIKAAIKDWEHFYDGEDQVLKCTPANVEVMCRDAAFLKFVDTCMAELRQRKAEQDKADLKN